MHEVGIMREVLEMAERAARDAGCDVIGKVVVRVGAFSGVVPEALEFAFAALQGDWPMLASAHLEIQSVRGSAFCETCQREFAVDDPIFLCPTCDQPTARLVRGRELDLLSIEAQESDSPKAAGKGRMGTQA
ncbi:MAG: hydrogenase maturation nickel metallochaperone HypA [Verrucomicrobiales bacterium]|nr:hydrogenase maturation nickel metallochaperone HypA [Verrucomicrobiales bacterium]